MGAQIGSGWIRQHRSCTGSCRLLGEPSTVGLCPWQGRVHVAGADPAGVQRDPAHEQPGREQNVCQDRRLVQRPEPGRGPLVEGQDSPPQVSGYVARLPPVGGTF